MSTPHPSGPDPWARHEWANALLGVVGRARATDLSTLRAPTSGPPARQAAVLILFGPGADGRGEVLLTERSHRMRSHPGQVSFPGGSVDPGDHSVVATALREAVEETGLKPAGVATIGLLPRLYLPPSHFQVTPVLAWWAQPSPVRAVDPNEVERAVVVPLPELLDPANRFSTRLSNGYVGPAFEVDGMFVWGFTAGLLSRLLALAGLEVGWDEAVLRPVPGFS